MRAAGGTGLGVLQAAADDGKLSIGVDSNQNHLHPGSVLTSMLKRVDVAVYNAFKGAKDGTLDSGMQSLGLAEDGVGYALDDNNRALISAEMEATLEEAKAEIIAGEIVVERLLLDPVESAAWPASPADRRWPRRRLRSSWSASTSGSAPVHANKSIDLVDPGRHASTASSARTAPASRP